MPASRAIKLYGTEEKVGETTELSAGALEATLDAGNLRYIKIGGTEAIRAIAYLVRNRNWGTYNPEISNLEVHQTASGFTVAYDALCKDDQQSFHYAARIEGSADGSLVFSAEGDPITDFVTNRTGFVVLHPLAGVVGAPLTVEHVDGRLVLRLPDKVMTFPMSCTRAVEALRTGRPADASTLPDLDHADGTVLIRRLLREAIVVPVDE